MKRWLAKNRWFIFLSVLIFCLGLFTRLWRLSQVPTSLAHDEMIYAINAQSLALSGTDLTGTWKPWTLTPMHPLFAELPTIFMAPFTLLPLEPILAAKLPFVVMSLVLPIILSGIAFELLRDKKTSFFVACISLFNPWLWQFGRMGFDSYWSLFFYSLGAYLLLRLPRWQKLWALVPFIIGFYQYQGHKLAFLPWVGIFVAYLVFQHIRPNKRSRWKYQIDWKKVRAPVLVFGVAAVLFLFYVFVQLPGQSSSSRIGTILLPSSPEIVQEVNEQRHLSLSTPVTGLGINKYTVWGEKLLERYAETYSPTHLFLRSQYSGFNVWSHGVFYVLDAGLIALGALALWKQGREFLLGLFAVGLVTTVLSAIIGNGGSFVFRPSLSLPFLLLLAGVGARYLFGWLPKWIFVFLATSYLVGIVHFAFTYFIRYPVYAAESSYFSDKILADYIRRSDPQKSIVIYTREPHFTYTAILFYNDWLNRENISQVQQSYKEESFEIRNVRLVNACIPESIEETESAMHIVRYDVLSCDEEDAQPVVSMPTQTGSSIALGGVKDSGLVYRIYGDSLCQGYQLPGFVYVSSLHSFAVKEVSQEVFCRTWFMSK